MTEGYDRPYIPVILKRGDFSLITIRRSAGWIWKPRTIMAQVNNWPHYSAKVDRLMVGRRSWRLLHERRDSHDSTSKVPMRIHPARQ